MRGILIIPKKNSMVLPAQGFESEERAGALDLPAWHYKQSRRLVVSLWNPAKR